jgi:excisionase family DNA binding protein
MLRSDGGWLVSLMPGERYLTTREVAELYRLSPATVNRWRKQGKLPAVELSTGVIRFDSEHLDAVVRERTTPGLGSATDPADAARRGPYPAALPSAVQPTRPPAANDD